MKAVMKGGSSTMLALLLLLSPLLVAGWGETYEKARLRDVQVLTLREGAMTTGRRSSPVPQLSCVGGSGRGRGEPGVVQCYNRGWDGREVQWECKADMEGSVRFGKVEVVCEGYDYPEDDYILAGSCGLEYTLELTREGRQQDSNSGGGWGQGGGYQKTSSGYGDQGNKWGGLGDLILLGVVGIIIYAFYKTCIDSNSLGDRQYSSTEDDYPGSNPGAGGWSNPNTGHGSAPGYGGAGPDANCGGGARRRGTGAGGLGGFWGGAATGGLLGYMFGGRNNGYGGYTGYNRGYRQGYGGGGGWGGGGGGWGASGGGGGMAAPASSGARTASGFGGTRRR